MGKITLLEVPFDEKHQVKLGISSPAFPVDTRRANAHVQEGERRRCNSPMSRGNGEDRVKVRQGKPVKRDINECREEGR